MIRLIPLAVLLCLLFAGEAHAQQEVNLNCYNGTKWVPASPTAPCPTGASDDSGPVSATATPANASHAAGVSVGGLFTIALARVSGGSGIITNILWKSNGGSIGALALRLWQKNPSNTTCTDNVAFAGSDTDDANLIGGGPFSLVPSAPASTTGDTGTYAALTGITYDYKNADTSPGQSIYACAVTVATDTADENRLVRLSLSGPRN